MYVFCELCYLQMKQPRPSHAKESIGLANVQGVESKGSMWSGVDSFYLAQATGLTGPSEGRTASIKKKMLQEQEAGRQSIVLLLRVWWERDTKDHPQQNTETQRWADRKNGTDLGWDFSGGPKSTSRQCGNTRGPHSV